MANIQDISGADRVVILGTREMLIYPFTAPNWTDLRIGFFISACSVSNDQTISGLSETLTTTGLPADRFWLGVKNNSNDALPTTAGTVFIGSANQPAAPDNSQSSKLTTFNSAAEWLVQTNVSSGGVQIWDGTTNKLLTLGTALITVPQNHSSTGGYASLVIIQLTRPTGTSTSVTLSIYTISRATFACATLEFTDTPTIAEIRAQFRNLSAYVAQSGGPFTLSSVPDAVYAYWPFNNSKIRIHSVCVEKFA